MASMLLTSLRSTAASESVALRDVARLGAHNLNELDWKMVQLASIGHVAIRVKDLDASLDFYCGKLGIPEMFRLFREDRVWLVYLRITDNQFLEIFPEGEGDRAPGKTAVGNNHFCLTVADIDTAEAEIIALGIPFSSPKKQVEDGNWQFWIEDPDGIRIEFMQMDPECQQIEAIRRMASAS